MIGSHDLHVEPDTIARLVSFADEHADVGILAPALVGPEPAAGGLWRNRAPTQRPPRARRGARRMPMGIRYLLVPSPSMCRGSRTIRRAAGVVLRGRRLWPSSDRCRLESCRHHHPAHAWGLGTASPNALGPAAANTVLLNAKREGLRSALASLCWFSARVIRGYAERRDVAPRNRRAQSRSVAHVRTVDCPPGLRRWSRRDAEAPI